MGDKHHSCIGTLQSEIVLGPGRGAGAYCRGLSVRMKSVAVLSSCLLLCSLYMPEITENKRIDMVGYI